MLQPHWRRAETKLNLTKRIENPLTLLAIRNSIRIKITISDYDKKFMFDKKKE